MANVFKEFARQELGHKAKLEKVKEGGALMPVQGKVQDLKIAEYAVDVSDSPDLNYQDALILAMKREKAAFKLYTQLAEISEDENLRNTFLALAQEEARHKLRIEVEYDDNILGEN